MAGLLSIDIAAFRFVNESLQHPWLDALMPFLSWNSLFVPLFLVVAAGMLWKGGMRGRLCLLLLVLTLVVCDAWVCHTLKHLWNRPRPFTALPEVRLLVGRGDSGSMPSSHAANWFAATLIVFTYYRRSLALMLPLAVLVSLSRIYNGVHYPSDVLVGALVGLGTAAATMGALEGMWCRWGGAWFPLWWRRLPSLLRCTGPSPGDDSIADGMADVRATGKAIPSTDAQEADQQWLRLGYLVIACILLGNLAYVASGKIELSEDEAYQWLWSKHLALSYYSKPPLIAYTQFLGTWIWGDTALGVRFFSPVIGAILSVLLLRFMAEQANARVGFWLVLVAAATPLLAVGSMLMTVDPLAVLFWIAALLSGWKAVRNGSTRSWLWTGLWMGLGFLSKYTAPFHLLCWAVFFVLWKPARAQLRRPGPYGALLILVLCSVPVLLWNFQHGWITLRHVAGHGKLDTPWTPSLRYVWDFLGSEFGLLNPVFLVAALWAAVAFWRRHRQNPLWVYLFSMGLPIFLFYLLFSLHSRVFPNWVALAVLPMFCLMVLYWETRWRAGTKSVPEWLGLGLGLGLSAVVLLHETDWVAKVIGHPLPAKQDPLRRVRAWSDTARAVGEARARLLTEGKPVFIICHHYGIAGLLSFYLPEAKQGVPYHPLVYFRSTDVPENQFFFWPGYLDRQGENAIYVLPTDTEQAPPESVQHEFVGVKNLGMRDIVYEGRLFRRLQLFECRGLR